MLSERESFPQRRPYDIVTILTVFLVLLVGLPSRLVFAPLGAAGTPAQILGIIALLGWCATCLTNVNARVAPARPMVFALFFFATAVVASYLASSIRPMTALEAQAADRGLLSLCAWSGILLLANAIPSKHRLDTLLRRVTFAGGALAALGILQFFTGKEFTNLIEIPGLSTNATLTSIINRNGLARAAGTALHPIEFGVVLAIILPLALHFALHDHQRSLPRRWAPVAAIAFGIPISISRSAILAAATALLFLLPIWPRAWRWRCAALVTILLAVVYVSVPGLLGTFKGLFTGFTGDSSTLSRTGSYTLAGQFISKSPLFGRGFATFLPSYRILDNQYLGTTIEMGFFGLTALLSVFAIGVLVGIRTRLKATDQETRHLAQSLAASVGAAGLSFATFDALSFPMVPGLLFLILGCTGALWRLESKPARADSGNPGGETRRSLRLIA